MHPLFIEWTLKEKERNTHGKLSKEIIQKQVFMEGNLLNKENYQKVASK